MMSAGKRYGGACWYHSCVQRSSCNGVELHSDGGSTRARIEWGVKIRMCAESKWHRRVSRVSNPGTQSESISNFVGYFKNERPGPYRFEIGMLRRIQNGGDIVWSLPRDPKGMLAGEAVNSISQ